MQYATVPAGAPIHFEFDGAVAMTVTIQATQPMSFSLNGSIQTELDGSDTAWLFARIVDGQVQYLHAIQGAAASVGEAYIGVLERGLRFRSDPAGDGRTLSWSWSLGCCWPAGNYSYVVIFGSSQPITRTTYDARFDPATASDWVFTSRTGELTLRDFDSTYAWSRFAGFGAGAAFDASASVQVDEGMMGFATYVPPDGPDIHHFTYAGPGRGDEIEDIKFFLGESPGTYDFNMAYQASAGQWPGQVYVLYADFPFPQAP